MDEEKLHLVNSSSVFVYGHPYQIKQYTLQMHPSYIHCELGLGRMLILAFEALFENAFECFEASFFNTT